MGGGDIGLQAPHYGGANGNNLLSAALCLVDCLCGIFRDDEAL